MKSNEHNVGNEIRDTENYQLPAVTAFERWSMIEYQAVQSRSQIMNPSGRKEDIENNQNDASIRNEREFDFNLYYQPYLFYKTVGVNLITGNFSYLTTSDGEVFNLPPDMAKDEKEYAHFCNKGKSREEIVNKLTQLIENRTQFHYDIAMLLCDKNYRIFVQNTPYAPINPKETTLDPFQEFILADTYSLYNTLISYAKRKERDVFFVPMEYLSDRYCHYCKHLLTIEQMLKEDENYDDLWDCPQCGLTHTKTFNTAINIKNDGEFMLGAPVIAGFQDANFIPRHRYYIINNNIPNMLPGPVQVI